MNRNFELVLNEMGPGRTSQAWCFRSPDYTVHALIYIFRLLLDSGLAAEWDVEYDRYFMGPDKEILCA